MISVNGTGGPHQDLRTRLYRFFAYYEPSQIEVLNQWLVNWAGHEQRLMSELILFHGPEPPLTFHVNARHLVDSRRQKCLQSCQSLLKNFFVFYAPERIMEVEKTMLAWKDRENDLEQRLLTQARQRDEVYKLYAAEFPHRLGEVQALLRAWLGFEGELIVFLQTNSPPPPRYPPPGPIVFDEGRRTPARESLRERIRYFYSVFHPEKLCEVDTILQVYHGREESLLRTLRVKYLDLDDDTPEPQGVPSSDAVALIRQLAEKWIPHRQSDVEAAMQPIIDEGSLLDILRALLSVPL